MKQQQLLKVLWINYLKIIFYVRNWYQRKIGPGVFNCIFNYDSERYMFMGASKDKPKTKESKFDVGKYFHKMHR